MTNIFICTDKDVTQFRRLTYARALVEIDLTNYISKYVTIRNWEYATIKQRIILENKPLFVVYVRKLDMKFLCRGRSAEETKPTH